MEYSMKLPFLAVKYKKRNYYAIIVDQLIHLVYSYQHEYSYFIIMKKYIAMALNGQTLLSWNEGGHNNDFA
jgi:hypothetical protein